MALPGDPATATAAAASTWLIGARPGRVTTRIARAHGAAPARVPGTFLVPTRRARVLARALRRTARLRYAEPNVQLTRRSAFDDQMGSWARGAVVPPTLGVPAAGGVSVAVIDDFVDPGHPDVAPQTRYLNIGSGTVDGPHGTQVASAAAGLGGNGGVAGVYPGLPILSYGLLASTCADVADGVLAAVDARAAVINLSLGGEKDCFTLFRAVSYAYAAGTVVVAAGGNEYLIGNPISYPAAYPHVLSVSALDENLASSAFSNANTSIDVAAPGERVPVATPIAFDDDGNPDGVTLADGTSFAAPMVAGAAAWLKAARPGLQNGQIADLLRRTATDVGSQGYDADNGFGLVNLPAALAAPRPAVDPLEPNDGITFVDGTAFSRPDPYVWRGTGSQQLRGAAVDAVEDPVDVYRIRVAPRSAFKILMTPSAGDPDMAIYSSAARSLRDTRHIIDQAPRGPGRTESVSLVNPSRAARSAFVVIDVDSSLSGTLDARYRLDFLRRRWRR